MPSPRLARRVLAEFLGTGLLVALALGSGIMAVSLSPHDVGLRPLENSLATAAGLTVLIMLLGPASDTLFNPVASLANRALGRRSPAGLAGGTWPPTWARRSP